MFNFVFRDLKRHKIYHINYDERQTYFTMKCPHIHLYNYLIDSEEEYL